MISIPNAVNVKVLLVKSWVFDYSDPSWIVNGINNSFAIPSASEIEVWADGKLVKGGGLDFTFTAPTTIVFSLGRQPYSSLSVAYLPI